jgi:HEAT repeat protein
MNVIDGAALAARSGKVRRRVPRNRQRRHNGYGRASGLARCVSGNLLGERKPNIKSLVRREDVSGLVDAASYRDVQPGQSGKPTDLGIPVRVEAVLGLGQLDPTGGGELVAMALSDPADAVRCAAVRALHSRPEPDTLVRALTWLPAGEGRSHKLALQAVSNLRDLVTAPMLAEALVHRQDEQLLDDDEAALILATLEDDPTAEDELVSSLVHALKDERGIVVDRAADLLVRLAPSSTGAVIAQLQTGPGSAEAAYVLGRIEDPRAVDALVEALGHRDANVRAESAAALGEFRDPSTVKQLLAATRDAEHSVRRHAGVALERLGAAAVIAGVAELLEPMIEEAVRSALARREAEADGFAPPPRTTKPQPRSRRSNGDTPNAKKARSTAKAEGTGKARSNTKRGATPKARPAPKPRATPKARPGVKGEPTENGAPTPQKSTENGSPTPTPPPPAASPTANGESSENGSPAQPS